MRNLDAFTRYKCSFIGPICHGFLREFDFHKQPEHIMIPFIIWGIKELVEDIAEDQVEKVATSVADKVLASLGECTLTEDELKLCADANEVQAAVLAKVKSKLGTA